ncbi:MAG: amidohydrolase family protein [Gemmatimonadales bacterium]
MARLSRCRRAILAGILACWSFAAGPVGAQTKAFRFAKVITSPGTTVDGGVVVVEGERIVAVLEAGAPLPDGATPVDLRPLVAIPGLIDAHVHATYYWDGRPGTLPWSQLSQRKPSTLLVPAQENLRAMLRVGVTSARDLYSPRQIAITLRDLVASGYVTGPRLFAAGCGLTKRPGATGCGNHSGGVEEVRRAAGLQLDAGADLVKVFGSTGSASDLSGTPTHSYEELLAAVQVAHERGKPVTVHSYGPEAARDAVRAGAESIEHAVGLDDETLRLMVERGTIYVPTIDHNRYYADHRDEFGYSSTVARNLMAFVDRNLETVRRAHQAGVRIAMGSDAVFTGFGENTRELAWFVEAGMTPVEALTTATVNGAMLLRMEDSLGQIAPGFYADLVGVRGDPSADIRAVIEGVRWVMKGGEVVFRAGR